VIIYVGIFSSIPISCGSFGDPEGEGVVWQALKLILKKIIEKYIVIKKYIVEEYPCHVKRNWY
jgi:hypothetical protein